MTDLEKRIVDLNLTWVWTGEAFTTVNNGHGFVIYYRNDHNWLAVLTPKVTGEQLQCHNTEPPEITGFWKPGSHYTARMFEIPVATAFLVHAIESVFPEMLALMDD